MIKKVLKLSASWCMPCKIYAKTFHDVSKEDEFKDITFEEYDVEENEDIAEKYLVRSVPTTVFLNENDDVLLKAPGNLSKKMLEETLKSKLNG